MQADKINFLEGMPLSCQPKAAISQTSKVMPQPIDLQGTVNSKLMYCPREEQLGLLYRILQPSIIEIDKVYSAITWDLTIVLNNLGFYYKIHQLGSTVTGLAFRGKSFRLQFAGKSDNNFLNDSTTDSPFDIVIEIPNRTVSIDRIIQIMIDPMHKLRSFHDIQPRINSHGPLITCFHTVTGFTFNISFIPEFKLVNSNVMKHLLRYDHRIHPLMFILTYWMQTHHLSGSGLISTDCLFLLVAFYLQTAQIRILPPYCLHQSFVPEVLVERTWNIGFNFNYFAPKTSGNTQLSVSDLLMGFFEFYRDYEFEKNIVCVLFGRSYDRAEFNANVPVEFGRYKLYLEQENAVKLNTTGVMCVQDPFRHHQNTANFNVSTEKKTFELFKAELAHAAKTCEKAIAEKKHLSLYTLFNSFADPTETVILQKSRFLLLERTGSKMNILRPFFLFIFSF